ncbi:RES family NAD+ phosphorylase [Roseovarius sp.]|uniref:RES family NAD+ phosphorylase n=1 Tax=Roseovarius sp. TaxID=1486281 RepID=UPI003D0AE8A5
MLEETKPPVPPECQHLHYLLFTPFRYGRYPWNSRFRRMGETPGVFYGAEDPITAVAETVWQRKIFFEGSAGTPLPKEPGTYTAFSVPVSTPISIDLTEPPMSDDAALWADPVDYNACLDLADRVRAEGCELIRYASVRHPDALENIAVLACQAFANPEPTQFQTWHLYLRPGRTQVRREHPKVSLEFAFGEDRLVLL